MHILITDSGVGGLSVCAYAERWLRSGGRSVEPVRLTFANAAPENDYGYNSMPTLAEKIETFDRFLRNVTDRCEPDLIYVACNTLSVLLEKIPYVQSSRIPVQGIVGTAVAQIIARYEATVGGIIIFATPTTIEADAYPRRLQERGVDPSTIVAQACPGLADTISEDRPGGKSKEEIRKWVRTAVERLPDDSGEVLALLACTHYGYRRDFFAEAFDELGIRAQVINPNEDAILDLSLPELVRGGEPRAVPVEVLTRYRIPPATLDALSFFLGEISPATVAALERYELVPELF